MSIKPTGCCIFDVPVAVTVVFSYRRKHVCVRRPRLERTFTYIFSEYVGHSFRQKFCFREENLFLNGRKVRENSLVLELIFDWIIDKQINAEHGPRPPTVQIMPFVTKINYTSYLTSILIKMI